MRSLPEKLETDPVALRDALADERIAAFDFETSDVRPRQAIIAGLGVYLPDQERCFYINTGHQIPDQRFPLVPEAQLVAAIKPFLTHPRRHMLAHNATYELRLMLKLGLDIRCRVSCTIIHTHRTDENIKGFGEDYTHHYYVPKVSYGLKELTTVFFRQRPPTLHGTIGAKNTISAPVYDVATYCAQDCVNCYNLFERGKGIIDQDQKLRHLIDEIDDPNNWVLAKMMWEGILVDVCEAARQKDAYEKAIQECREEIWRATGTSHAIDTPSDVLATLKGIGLELPSHRRELLEAQFSEELSGIEEDQSESLATECEGAGSDLKKKVVAAFLSKMQMQQRLSAFLVPLPEFVKYSQGRLYPSRFSSTLVTTRFSSSPNLQNLPGKADKVDPNDAWRGLLPDACIENQKTRDIFVAKPGCVLCSVDLSAAEPRYLAMLFQRALEQREAGYNAEKYRRQAMRWDRYPVLMRKMLETRKPLTRGIEPDTIQWPTFAEDPLWRVFKYGKPFDDPYNALLVAMDRQGYEQALASGGGEQWLSDHRWRGKRAFLALAYGSQAETLAPQLDWTVEKTGQAIKNLEEEYATLPPMRMLTQLELVHLGGVRTLAGRPRRVNGYWQLTHPEPVTVSFYRMRPNPRTYIARIVPLGTTRMGVQAFIEECCVELDGGTKGELVLEGKSDGTVAYISRGDPFVRADHFNVPPFRNINYNQINWVRDADGLVRHLSEQARGFRQAFNAMCQGTGADHLRWIMNNVDSEVVTKPAFRDCHLVLTIHDSLMYEVPEAKVKSFIEAIGPVVTRRPSWADIDIKAKFEVGHSAGQMKEFTIP